MNRDERARFWTGVLRVSDPKITLASVASMVLGAAFAAAEGPLHVGWLLLTVLGIFAVEAAKNASGEIVDFDSGDDLAVEAVDRSPFSGGKRVLVDALMSRRQLILVAAAFYGLAAAVGLAIVLFREPRVLGLGVLGMALAFFYHAPPLKLSYRGLGEVAVAIAYGPVIALGTHLVQRHALSVPLLLASLPLALLVADFLWINEFPDYRADRAANKRTWVVRLGRPRASRVFAALGALAFLLTLLLPALGLSPGLWLGLLGAPPMLLAARQLLAHPEETPLIVPAQAKALQSFVLFALGAGAGVLLVG